jgi:hypothetical protein
MGRRGAYFRRLILCSLKFFHYYISCMWNLILTWRSAADGGHLYRGGHGVCLRVRVQRSLQHDP